MNCFHFSVSLGYKTTWCKVSRNLLQLWIAFIFQYLWDTKQLFVKFWHRTFSCELLSFFSIFGIQNNKIPLSPPKTPVVNCFHFSVSLGYKTTRFSRSVQRFLLWIAFIFQYLWDTKQLFNFCCSMSSCCELLSFFSIFGIQNNFLAIEMKTKTVVNCFHFSVSLGYKTTGKTNKLFYYRLWIAFIFQYLWDTKQRICKRLAQRSSCELLSFFSIFGIQNNSIFNFLISEFVVNCFHFSVSLGYKTTLLTSTPNR